MGELIATQITPEEARSRLVDRFGRWPNIGYRFSNAPGHSADITTDGFVVRGLPRVTATPVMEAVGRWRDRGAEVELRPMLRTYLPSMLVNSIVIAVVFFGIMVLQDGGRSPLGAAARVAILFVLTLAVLGLVTQLLLFAYLVVRNRGREGRELMTVVREVLGP